MTTRAGDRWSEEGRDTESEGNILNEKSMEILQRVLLSRWGGEFVWAGQDTGVCVWGGVTSGQINPKYSIQYLSSCAAWSPERQVSPQLERYRELISTGVEIRTPASPIYTFITFWPPFLSLTCYCLLQTSVTIYLSSRTTSASPARQGVIFNFSQRPDAGRNNWTASYFMERALFFLLTDSKISHKYGETARQQQERAGFHHRAQPKATLPK